MALYTVTTYRIKHRAQRDGGPYEEKTALENVEAASAVQALEIAALGFISHEYTSIAGAHGGVNMIDQAHSQLVPSSGKTGAFAVRNGFAC